MTLRQWMMAEVGMYVGEGRGRTVWKAKVRAYYSPDVRGLMVHRPMLPDGTTRAKGWIISHVGTGSALTLWELPTLASAEHALAILAPLADWQRPGSAFGGDYTLGAIARTVIADTASRFGGRREEDR